MLTAYERRLVLTYLVNAVRRLQRGTSETKALYEWVSENSDLLRPESSLVELCRARARRRKSKASVSKDEPDEVRDLLAKGVQGAEHAESGQIGWHRGFGASGARCSLLAPMWRSSRS